MSRRDLAGDESRRIAVYSKIPGLPKRKAERGEASGFYEADDVSLSVCGGRLEYHRTTVGSSHFRKNQAGRALR